MRGEFHETRKQPVLWKNFLEKFRETEREREFGFHGMGKNWKRYSNSRGGRDPLSRQARDIQGYPRSFHGGVRSVSNLMALQ